MGGVWRAGWAGSSSGSSFTLDLHPAVPGRVGRLNSVLFRGSYCLQFLKKTLLDQGADICLPINSKGFANGFRYWPWLLLNRVALCIMSVALWTSLDLVGLIVVYMLNVVPYKSTMVLAWTCE